MICSSFASASMASRVGQSLEWAPVVFAALTSGRCPCPRLGGPLARRSARAASPPSPLCFAHACGAELFYQPPMPRPFHQVWRDSELAYRDSRLCAGRSSSPAFAARAPLGVINSRCKVLLVH